MTNTVKNAVLFHINRRDEFQPRDKMKVGDRVTIGENLNPMTSAFHRLVRSYPMHLPNGKVQPWGSVHFLRSVASRAIPAPKDHATFAAEISLQMLLLIRELVFEDVRAAEFADTPARRTCIWVAETEADIQAWSKMMLAAQGLQKFQIVELRGTGTMHKADLAQLDMDWIPVPEMEARARKYWSGEKSAGTHPDEILFQGDVTVERIVDDRWKA